MFGVHPAKARDINNCKKCRLNKIINFAGVAQVVEQLIRNQ